MNKLTIKNQKNKELNTLEEWKKEFIEIDEKRHWEEGRSAERLANDFLKGNPSSGEKSLRQMLSLFLNSDDVVWKGAYIEHGSVFDSYPKPRMQDMAIWAEANGKTLFIGVEAKVDEPFGSRSVAQQKKYVKGLIADGVKTKADKRLEELCGDFIPAINPEDHGKIRYQLLYYLAGSFRENAEIVFMPVFAYVSDKYDHKKGEKNYKDYVNFMELLGFEKVNGDVPGMKIAYKKTITAPNKERTSDLTKTVYSIYFSK